MCITDADADILIPHHKGTTLTPLQSTTDGVFPSTVTSDHVILEFQTLFTTTEVSHAGTERAENIQIIIIYIQKVDNVIPT